MSENTVEVCSPTSKDLVQVRYNDYVENLMYDRGVEVSTFTRKTLEKFRDTLILTAGVLSSSSIEKPLICKDSIALVIQSVNERISSLPISKSVCEELRDSLVYVFSKHLDLNLQTT